MRAPPRGPTSSIFMQFSAKILPNNKCLLQDQLLVSPLPMGNPRSVTGLTLQNRWDLIDFIGTNLSSDRKCLRLATFAPCVPFAMI